MSKPKNGQTIGKLFEDINIFKLGITMTHRKIVNAYETKHILEQFGEADWKILYLPLDKVSPNMMETIVKAFEDQTDTEAGITNLTNQQKISKYLSIHQLEAQPWENDGVLILTPMLLQKFNDVFRDNDQLEEWGDIARKWLCYSKKVCFYIHGDHVHGDTIMDYIHDKALAKIDLDVHELRMNSTRLQLLLEIHLDNQIDWDNLQKFGLIVTNILQKINHEVFEFSTHIMEEIVKWETKLHKSEEERSKLTTQCNDAGSQKIISIFRKLGKANNDCSSYSYQLRMCTWKLDRLTDHKSVLAKASGFRDKYCRLMRMKDETNTDERSGSQ